MARLGRKSPGDSRPHFLSRQMSTILNKAGDSRGEATPVFASIGSGGRVDRRAPPLKWLYVPPERRHISFRHIVRAAGERAVTSHMLPAYARVDLAFERGEGAWLIATDGERYLDLPRASRSMRSAIRIRTWSQRSPSRPPRFSTSPTSTASPKASGWPTGCARRASPTRCSSPTPAPRRWKASSRWCANTSRRTASPERYRIITFEGAFHGRTLATLAAAKNEKHTRRLRADDGRLRPGSARRHRGGEARHRARDRRHPDRADARRGRRARAAPPQFFRALRALCDEHGLLLAFDEVQTGIGRLGELFGYQLRGVTPDVMALAKGLGGGFPIGAVLGTAEAAKGMTPGTHGSTFGGNPLAMAAGNAVLDVMLKPGFLDHVATIALLFKQRLAELKDRHPSVIAEVRGEGLLIGLRAVVPNGDLVDALRAEKLLSVGAGDNVVRLLPPLIISEAEVAEAVRADRSRLHRMERARQGAQQARERPDERQRRPALSRPDRYSAPANCAGSSTTSRAMKSEAARRRRKRPAGRQDAGHDLRQAVDAHARLVRRRHAAARRRIDHAHRPGDAARPRRNHRRHRARAVALCRCHHDPHARSRQTWSSWRRTPPCRSSTA